MLTHPPRPQPPRPQRVVRNPTPLASDGDHDLDTWELLSYAGVTDDDVLEAARRLGVAHLGRCPGDEPLWPAAGRLFRCASGLELPVVPVRVTRRLPGGATTTLTVVAFLDCSSPASYFTAEAFAAFGHPGVVTGPQAGYRCTGSVPIRPRAAHGQAAAVCVLGADFLRHAHVQIDFDSSDGAVTVQPKEAHGAPDGGAAASAMMIQGRL